ncbi:hypothetical protein NC99_37550 [Sunxiuqinia dokdonensis]|uniref:Uncharacterized protein n=1 Tax=Sunxiuqinia dokdonensis TaxID=1409788 RepID=A0A0L8V5D5_9BACT|nr:hypothetical protein NC99_37550 [Sunxiuqinia dokdonensis]
MKMLRHKNYLKEQTNFYRMVEAKRGLSLMQSFLTIILLFMIRSSSRATKSSFSNPLTITEAFGSSSKRISHL